MSGLLFAITIWSLQREDYGRLEKLLTTALHLLLLLLLHPSSAYLQFHFHIRFSSSALPLLSPLKFFLSSS